MNNKSLYRTSDDQMLGGVCGGLARYFGVPSSTARIIALCLIIFGGLSLWVYIIMWLLMPLK